MAATQEFSGVEVFRNDVQAELQPKYPMVIYDSRRERPEHAQPSGDIIIPDATNFLILHLDGLYKNRNTHTSDISNEDFESNAREAFYSLGRLANFLAEPERNMRLELVTGYDGMKKRTVAIDRIVQKGPKLQHLRVGSMRFSKLARHVSEGCALQIVEANGGVVYSADTESALFEDTKDVARPTSERRAKREKIARSLGFSGLKSILSK